MSSAFSVAPETLSRRIAAPDAPILIDVRIDEDFTADPRLLPGAKRRPYEAVPDWGPSLVGAEVVVVCHRGLKLSQGVAAWLRHLGARATALEGGAAAWAEAGLPMIREAAIPAPGRAGATLWVTRERPKVDRIACPWLIRRFVDRDAVFLYVGAAEVAAVAERFGATPFDVEGAFWSHRGELCSFDVMLAEFGLASPALERLARVVRGADTGRPELAAEAAGLLAACLGLSRLHGDDLRQLEAGLPLFDAFYRWSLQAADETHSWPAQRLSA